MLGVFVQLLALLPHLDLEFLDPVGSVGGDGAGVVELGLELDDLTVEAFPFAPLVLVI